MIGQFETQMSKICGSKGQTITGTLTMPGKDKERGQISIRAVSEAEASVNPGLQPSPHPQPV